MKDTDKPVIGITMGDPAGIGPEISVKALMDEAVYTWCRPVLVGDAGVMEQTVRMLGSTVSLRRLASLSNAQFRYGRIDLIDTADVDLSRLEYGRVSAMTGNAAFETVKHVIELAMEGSIDATVTGPINKEALHLAGHRFSGHTEIFAHFTGTKKYAMLLVHENLRVIHVSTHVSLRRACDLVRRKRILEVVDLLDTACRRLGIDQPRIGVAGLNPHSGDGGLFGSEEVDEIIPAVKAAQEKGYRVEGPVPADTLFAKAAGGLYDGCVAMYHDQGHIPFKLKGFIWDETNRRMKSVQGVNITLGLPVIRTSVDHGTAFEIAGQGIASPDALILAIRYAAQLVRSR